MSNISRREFLHTLAIASAGGFALDSGIVSGAGLDVVEDMPLIGQRQNVLITAHNAYNSFEALAHIKATVTANIMAFKKHQELNLV
mgnify:CR=1 FL=1